MFEHITEFPSDPILGLVEKFKKDPRSEKINLSIGLYYDEDGNIPQLKAIKKAKEIYWNTQNGPSSYLPIGGLQSYCDSTQKLIFGKNSKGVQTGKITTVQSLGGSGALNTGALFLHTWFPDSKVYVSNPTWANHIGIFENADFDVQKYPYFSKEKFDVDFDAMYEFIATLPSKSIILLHPCCHNPTGADLTPQQWDRLTILLKEKGHIPFLDIAYQGMGKGFEEDAYAIRKMEAEGLSFVVSQSFSKIFSLYGERVGTLSVVCSDKEEAKKVHSQLNGTIRKVYSNPPTFGATLIDIVLKDESLTHLWLSEVEEMRVRIQDMRASLAAELKTLGVEEKDYNYITKQSGMFSFTNFSKEAIVKLRENKGIYMVENGRICIAGLTKKNIPIVASALQECYRARNICASLKR